MNEQDLSPHSAHSRDQRQQQHDVSGHLDHPDLGLGLAGPSGEDLVQWEKRCGEDSLCSSLCVCVAHHYTLSLIIIIIIIIIITIITLLCPAALLSDSLCRRVQLLTCNLFGGAGVGDDMATVGRVFSNFFHHEVSQSPQQSAEQ
jgi:hypothetical protein